MLKKNQSAKAPATRGSKADKPHAASDLAEALSFYGSLGHGGVACDVSQANDRLGAEITARADGAGRVTRSGLNRKALANAERSLHEIMDELRRGLDCVRALRGGYSRCPDCGEEIA